MYPPEPGSCNTIPADRDPKNILGGTSRWKDGSAWWDCGMITKLNSEVWELWLRRYDQGTAKDQG
jgi:hypothetical protein